MRPLLLFIAGPYAGDISANIARARDVALEIWRAGHYALCPHSNTAHLEGLGVPEETFKAGDLRMLSHCDGVVLIEGWEQSEGAVAEFGRAKQIGLPCWVWPDGPRGAE